jgi:hypothetical protein
MPLLIDEDELAKDLNFRNFISFIAKYYLQEKLSLKECGVLLGVSSFKIKTSLLERGFELRKPGIVPGNAPKLKRSVDLHERVRIYTSFKSPEEAFHVLYEEYFLTSYEIAKILKVSPPFVCKCLRNFGINLRKKGAKSYGGKW